MLIHGDMAADELQQDTASLCTMGGYQDRITPAPTGDIATADQHHIPILAASSLQQHNRGKNARITVERHQRLRCLVSV